MTDPIAPAPIAPPPPGHAIFYADIQQLKTVDAVSNGSETVVDFDGLPDKITYVSNDLINVQYATRGADGAISYGAPNLLSTRPGGDAYATVDIDGDRKEDIYAFGDAKGKVYLMADTSKTVEDIAEEKSATYQNGNLVVDLNGDGLTEVIVPMTDAQGKSALETQCEVQFRYCMVIGGAATALARGLFGPSASECYTTPRDTGIGTVYIKQQWVE